MTATANKQGLKAAAAKRTARAAQRTALPPKATEAEAQQGSARYGMMTVAQLKVEAKSLGLITHTLRNKGALLNAILARLQTPAAQEVRAEAKVDATFSGPLPGDEIVIDDDSANTVVFSGPCPQCGNHIQEWSNKDHSYTVITDTDTDTDTEKEHECPTSAESLALIGKSGPKATRFAEKAEALGWFVQLHHSQTSEDWARADATREVIGRALRGTDRIVIEWMNGVFVGEFCFHTTPAGRQLKLRNASECLRRMRMQPAEIDAEDIKTTGNRTYSPRRPKTSEEATEAARRPYFPVDATDVEVLAEVTVA